MSVEEELQEQMEKVHDPFEKRVAGSMAILAACLAVVSVMGHLATTEEIVDQARASDQWAYYQAKSIRRYESEIARDILAAQPEKMAEYQKNVGKYTKEGEEIQKEAQGLEDESHLKGRQAVRFEFSEVFFEVAIVLASLAILTKLKPVWWIAIATGIGGLAVAATVSLIK
jgi:ABC-type Zn2+ transport system substrate-binding protein/surface adhesin